MIKECEDSMKNAKEYVRKLQIISINNKEKEGSPEEPDNFNDLAGNQKLGLCEALLLVGDWENAQILIKRLPERYAVTYAPVAVALCGLLHHIVEPVYNQ